MNPVFVTTALTAISSLDIQRTNRQIAELELLQTGILARMSDTLHHMSDEMKQIKQQQGEALAIQRELLARDNLQAYLEEFIYQADKFVSACAKEDAELDKPTRFFLLRGFIEYVASEGIATPMIRGRENKAAFDEAMDKAKATKMVLSGAKEVCEAIESARKAQEENERAAREAERAAKEAQREQRNRNAKRGFIVLGAFAAGLLLCCCIPSCLGVLINNRPK